jgi:hypothetical protein
MKKLVYFLALMLPILFFAFRLAPTPKDSECTCGAPTNVVKTEVTRSSITFDWDDVENASLYILTARKAGTKKTNYTASTSTFTFDNLAPGTYEFTFTTDCDGEFSESIVISDVIF